MKVTPAKILYECMTEKFENDLLYYYLLIYILNKKTVGHCQEKEGET